MANNPLKLKIKISANHQELSLDELTNIVSENNEKHPIVVKFFEFVSNNQDSCTPLVCDEWTLDIVARNLKIPKELMKQEIENNLMYLLTTQGPILNIFSEQELINMLNICFDGTYEVLSLKTEGIKKALTTHFYQGPQTPTNILLDVYDQNAEDYLFQPN